MIEANMLLIFTETFTKGVNALIVNGHLLPNRRNLVIKLFIL